MRIVRGDLSSETAFPKEADLEDEFGVSRSVIREAVKTLAASATSMWVRRPAGRLRTSRSIPMIMPRSAARPSRAAISTVGVTVSSTPSSHVRSMRHLLVR